LSVTWPVPQVGAAVVAALLSVVAVVEESPPGALHAELASVPTRARAASIGRLRLDRGRLVDKWNISGLLGWAEPR
jgi:hypothetical protein